MVTVIVLICTYAALIAKGTNKIRLYALVVILIMGSIIIAYLGTIEQMGEETQKQDGAVTYMPLSDIIFQIKSELLHKNI